MLFPVGGGTDPVAKISKICMELRKFWAIRGAHWGHPIRSTTATIAMDITIQELQPFVHAHVH